MTSLTIRQQVAATAMAVLGFYRRHGLLCSARSGAVMTQQRDSMLTFGVMIAIGAAMTAAAGFQVMIGFAVGVIFTLGAAAVAGADFD